jgi:hypothetical protein
MDKFLTEFRPAAFVVPSLSAGYYGPFEAQSDASSKINGLIYRAILTACNTIYYSATGKVRWDTGEVDLFYFIISCSKL